MVEIVKTASKNTLFLYINQILNKIITFIFIIYIVRYLGAEDFGKYSYAYTFSSFFFLFAMMGMSNLQIREISRHRDDAGRYFGNIVVLRAFFSALALAVLLTLTMFLQYPSDTLLALRIFGASIIFQAFTCTLWDCFIAYEKMFYYSFLILINNLLISTASVAAVILGYGLIEISWLWLGGWALTVFAGLYLVNKHLFKPRLEFDLSFSKGLVRDAVPFALSTVVFMLFLKVDTVLIYSFKGAGATGLYSSAFRIMEALMFVPQSLMLALYPALSVLYTKSHSSLKDVLGKSFKLLFLISFPLAVGGFVLSEKIVLLLYASGFREAAPAFAILILGYVLVALREGFIMALNSANLQKKNFYVDLIGLVFKVILSLALIPVFSATGAAAATVISYIAVVAFSLYYSLRSIGDFSLQSHIFRPLAAAAGMGVVLYLIGDAANTVILILTGAAVYTVLAFLFRAVTREEVGKILSALRGS